MIARLDLYLLNTRGTFLLKLATSSVVSVIICGLFILIQLLVKYGMWEVVHYVFFYDLGGYMQLSKHQPLC